MTERSTSSNRNLWVILALILAVGVAIWAIRGSFRSKATVRTTTASLADMTNTVSTNGKVEPVEDFQAHAPTAGVIKSIPVAVGQQVQTGQRLILMDDSDARSKVAAARASVDLAASSLANMQHGGTADENLAASNDLTNAITTQRLAASALASTEALQARGSASANEVANARQKLADAQARITQLQARRTGRYNSGDVSAQRAQLTQAQASLAAAQSAYAGVDIRAPFPGTVYAIPVSSFDFVQFGEALMNLADLHHIQVRAYFDEPEIGKLHVGQPVKIVWDAKPNATWHGHIQRAPTTIITYGTRNVGECIITVDDATGDLLPNTNVTVTVTTSQKKNILSIPREALHTDGARNFVYRIVDGHIQSFPVQPGSINLTRVEILSGLHDGETVVLNSATGGDLADGTAVKVLP